MNKAQQASVELWAMDELAAQDSPMHRLSPLSKLFVTVLYIVVTVSFHKYGISGVFVMVLFPLVGYQVSMIPVHTCFHKLRVVMPLVCAVGLFNPFFDKQITVRGLVATMNFLMWFGNTTILLMAGIMGIDQNLFEAANLDGANSLQVFFRVTLPLLMPVLVYTIITALIGGLQMFDVPQVLTNGAGTPNRSSTTLIMYLNNFLKTSKNYGMAGAVSVIIFIITGLLSILVFKSLTQDDN